MAYERVPSDNPLWFCCCCGCLPWLAIIKMIFILPVCIAIIAPSCLVIAIILLPHDIYFTYYSWLVTKQFGPNLKCLAVLLLWAPLIGWPPFVFVSSLFFSLGLSTYWAFVATFDDEYNLCVGGILEGWMNSIDYVKEFWDFNYNSYFAYLAEFRGPLQDGEVAFDIRIIDIFIGLIICVIAVLVDFPALTFISIAYCIPCVIKAYYYWFKAIWETLNSDGCAWICACFPFVIVSFILVPVAAVLACSGIALYGIFLGPLCAVEAYNNGIPAAFTKMAKSVWEVNTDLYLEFLCKLRIL